MIQKDMKILVIGVGDYPIYEKAIYNAFHELGYENAELFVWNKYLNNSIISKIQNKYQVGPVINKINKDILEYCISNRPELIFVQSGILVYGKTIRKIKEKIDTKIFYYNNDDPFADYYNKHHWRHYKAAIKYADYNFVYRPKNCEDIKKLCDVPTEVLRSYYVEGLNHLIDKNEVIEDVPDVLFLGHFEEDERSEYLKALTDKGIKVGVPEEHYHKFYQFNHDLIPVGDSHSKYNRLLGSCKIPLIFFSKINHDTYTRRCFEIPAVGGLIFSPYTEDMASMFKENEEAVYYRDKNDFVEKVEYYLSNENKREEIARAGYSRLMADGHEVKDRVKHILDVYAEMRNL